THTHTHTLTYTHTHTHTLTHTLTHTHTHTLTYTHTHSHTHTHTEAFPMETTAGIMLHTCSAFTLSCSKMLSIMLAGRQGGSQGAVLLWRCAVIARRSTCTR